MASELPVMDVSNQQSQTTTAVGAGDASDDEDFEVIPPPPATHDEHCSSSVDISDDFEFRSDFEGKAAPTEEGAVDTCTTNTVDQILKNECDGDKNAAEADSLKTEIKQQQEFITALRKLVADLERDLLETKVEAADLSEENRKNREKLQILSESKDALMAKVCEQEELLNCQSSLIRQLKDEKGKAASDLTAEQKNLLEAKDNVIRNLHQQLDAFEGQFREEKDRADNLQAIVDVLQEENNDSRRLMGEQRNVHRAEVTALRQQLQEITQTLAAVGLNNDRRRSSTDSTQPGPIEVYTCERCHLRLASRQLYTDHLTTCTPPAIIRVEQTD